MNDEIDEDKWHGYAKQAYIIENNSL